MTGMLLASVSNGKEVKIKEIASGWRLRKRLGELGLYEGTRIKMVENTLSGPVILKVLDSRIAIGRGQAQKIVVEVL